MTASDITKGGERIGSIATIWKNLFPFIVVLLMEKANTNPMIVERTPTTTPSLMLLNRAVPMFVFSRTYLIDDMLKLPSASVMHVINNLIIGYMQNTTNITRIIAMMANRPG